MKIGNKGAASILVILIVVVLATFGGIALTTGWTNKQLSIKAAQSKADYYVVDSAAEEILAEIDNKLYFAAKSAEGYLNVLSDIEDKEALKNEIKLQALFVEEPSAIKSPALKTKIIFGVFDRIYFYECARGLERLAKEYNLSLDYSDGYECAEDFLNPEKTIPSEADLTISFTVSEEPDEGNKNLDIVIAVKAPAITVSFMDSELWQTDFNIVKDSEDKRFIIYSWKLWQNPIEDEEDKPKFG